MLSEIILDNDERVSIPNFDCCEQLNRPGHRAACVAIYRKQKNSHVVTPHMDITYRQTSGLGIVNHDIGDTSAAECLFENGQTVMFVSFSIQVIYISCNQMVKKINDFLNFVLLPYTEGDSALLKNCHLLPMILSGDFNFFSLPKAEPLIAFLNDELKLEMNTNQNVSATNNGNVIDAVFFNGF
ncbi:hypothetical protein TNCV_3696681 [Trichonephila clavipes]|uniref:Uncharacterized protein n=1 Tax=Trichonephila clavipes TaxID=2585209 RepID=A0A8X6SCH4_TRICX|nr:hypothetical protein TNCV_3696681 [Trichonephila clavipes]